MRLIRSDRPKSRAQAMVEFAIALPVLLALLYGILEAGRLLFIYSTVINASRQAVRYGSAVGPGIDWTSKGGPNNSINDIKRYQDCWGIRYTAQKVDFFNAFDDKNIIITYDKGPGQGLEAFDCADPNSNTKVTPSDKNTTRINVEIRGNYIPLVPKLVAFMERTVANNKPIRGISARSIIIKVNIEVTQAAPATETTTTTITAHTPDPSKVGELVPVTVTVTGASTMPTGSVSINGANTNCTVILSGGTGTCNVIFNSGGAKTLTATYNPDATHLASSDSKPHTVLYPVTLSVTASPDPVTSGKTVTITVIATSDPLNPVPNGSPVQITGDGISCTVILNKSGQDIKGSCTVVFNTTTTATKKITASYTGDANHSSATGTTDIDVILNKDTITRITSDAPDPSEIGQAVTVSVTVVALSGNPSGTVSITGADSNCTISLTTGKGSCTVVFNSAGNKTITASYSGSANHNPSVGTASHAVNVQTTTTTITSHQPDPSQVGQNVTVTATVTGGTTTPTGAVTITGASAPCTITLVNGTGSCLVTFASSGSKTLSAAYNGDATHATSNGTATHTVSVITATPVPSCTGIKFGALSKSNNTMTLLIDNSAQAYPMSIGYVTVTWNNDKGHNLGNDKSLILQSASLIGAATTTFWTGTNIGPTLTITPPVTTTVEIPANGSATLTFTFDKSYDNFNRNEAVVINWSTPGCNTPSAVK